MIKRQKDGLFLMGAQIIYWPSDHMCLTLCFISKYLSMAEGGGDTACPLGLIYEDQAEEVITFAQSVC